MGRNLRKNRQTGAGKSAASKSSVATKSYAANKSAANKSAANKANASTTSASKEANAPANKSVQKGSVERREQEQQQEDVRQMEEDSSSTTVEEVSTTSPMSTSEDEENTNPLMGDEDADTKCLEEKNEAVVSSQNLDPNLKKRHALSAGENLTTRDEGKTENEQPGQKTSGVASQAPQEASQETEASTRKGRKIIPLRNAIIYRIFEGAQISNPLFDDQTIIKLSLRKLNELTLLNAMAAISGIMPPADCDFYQLYSLDDVVNQLYPTPGLRYLADIKHSPTREDPRSGPVLEKFYVLVVNSFALHVHTCFRHLIDKLKSFWKSKFIDEDNQFKELDDLVHEVDPKFFHVMVLMTTFKRDKKDKNALSLATPPFDGRHFEVMSGAMVHADQSSGAFVDYIATSHQLLKRDIAGAAKDDLPMAERGLATLVLMVIEFYLEAAKFSHVLWATVNQDHVMPSLWYRQKLWFAPIIDGVKPPAYIQNRLSHNDLVLYHSTGRLRVCLATFKCLPVDTSFEKLTFFADSILRSYGMPPFHGERIPPSKGQTGAFCKTMQAAVTDKELNPGDDWHDEYEGPSCESEDLERLYMKNAERSRPKYQVPSRVRVIDNGQGTLGGVYEEDRAEASCTYLNISYGLWGDTKYYWRLRMIVGHFFRMLSFLPPEHAMCQKNSVLMVTFCADCDVDFLDETEPNFQNWFSTYTPEGVDINKQDSGDAYVRTTQSLKAFKLCSQLVMNGSVDSGQVELKLLNSFIDGRIWALSPNPTPRFRDLIGDFEPRTWRVGLSECSTTHNFFSLTYDAVPNLPMEDDDKVILLGAVIGPHYVWLEFSDEVTENLSANEGREGRAESKDSKKDDTATLQKAPASKKPTSSLKRPIQDEEEPVVVPFELHDCVVEACATVTNQLAKEQKNRKTKELYKFPEYQVDFDSARDHFRDTVVDSTKQKIDRLKANRIKCEAFLNATPKNQSRTRRRNFQRLRQKKEAEMTQIQAHLEVMNKKLLWDRESELVEASLLMRDYVTHIEKKGKSWSVVCKVPIPKTSNKFNEVLVSVTDSWVRRNFHSDFIEYMKDQGEVDAWYRFEEHDKVYWRNLKTRMKHGLLTKIDVRFFLDREQRSKDGNLYNLFGFFKRVDKEKHRNENDLDSIVKEHETMLDNEWIRSELRKHALEDLLNKAIERANSIVGDETLRNEANTPCFSRHKTGGRSNHSSSCFVRQQVELPKGINIHLELDLQQVSKIRWNHDHNRWEGIVKWFVSGKPQQQIEPLTTEWLHENFDEDFIRELESHAASDRKFVTIPPGGPRKSDKIPFDLVREDAPVIRYVCPIKYQAWTCASDSMASALYFRGKDEYAQKVFELGLEVTNNRVNRCSTIVEQIRNLMNTFGRFYIPHKIRRTIGLDEFLVPSPKFKLLVLMADDGDTSHAVTTYQEWIFDSGFNRALPLVQKSFDICCGQDCICVGIVRGVAFHGRPQDAKNYKIKPKRKGLSDPVTESTHRTAPAESATATLGCAPDVNSYSYEPKLKKLRFSDTVTILTSHTAVTESRTATSESSTVMEASPYSTAARITIGGKIYSVQIEGPSNDMSVL